MNQHPMRALSLWRPWPWLILHNGKNVENRRWTTTYRGALVLHAGRHVQRQVCDEIAEHHSSLPYAALATGFVGTAQLIDVHHADRCRDQYGPDLCSPWAEDACYHWQLTTPRPFARPIPGPGRQRLFTPPAGVGSAAFRSRRGGSR